MIKNLSVETYKIDPNDRYILIKTSQQARENAREWYPKASEEELTYHAVRMAWRLSLDRAKKYKFVIGSINGIVVGCYKNCKWSKDESGTRIKFEGEEAVEVLKNAGAFPVWAHPLGGEGEEHISQSKFLQQLETMKELGIKGLECYYSRYNEDEIEFLVDVAKQNDLLISGGSDYHGANKTVKLAQLNVDNEPICEENLSIIKNSGILLK